VSEYANVHDGATYFGYQGLAGLSFKATEHLNFDLTYRYLGAENVRFSLVNTTPGGTLQPGDVQGRYEDQLVSVGLREDFGAPPAPPASPSPPRRRPRRSWPRISWSISRLTNMR
jgi:OOP family OmpA-OmpF porin